MPESAEALRLLMAGAWLDVTKVMPSEVALLPTASDETALKSYVVKLWRPSTRTEWTVVRAVLIGVEAEYEPLVPNSTCEVASSSVVQLTTADVEVISVTWTFEMTGGAVSAGGSVLKV